MQGCHGTLTNGLAGSVDMFDAKRQLAAVAIVTYMLLE
jgi:hypothetical protein